MGKNNIHVIYVYADTPTEWNCSQWRNLTPADAMNKTATDGGGITAKLIHVSGFIDFLNPAIQDLVGVSNLIVFQRNMVDETAYASMEYWQGLGKPVVVDLDDAYHILPWSNPAHKFWLENNDSEAIFALEEGLKRSNGLIAPNRLLLSDWAHVVDGYYLQNFAERKWWVGLKSRQEMKAQYGFEDKIVIGWGGSVSHYDSWWGSGLREAAVRISQRHPEVVWMICGNDPRIHNQLDVPKFSKYAQPGVEPGQWPQVVKTFDIGVAPLFGPYDQRRSWIKTLEYGLASVPWVATKGEPYRDMQMYGKSIINDPDSWENTIEDMIANLAQEHEAAEQLVPFMEQFYADNQMGTYREVFESILDNVKVRHAALPGVIYV